MRIIMQSGTAINKLEYSQTENMCITDARRFFRNIFKGISYYPVSNGYKEFFVGKKLSYTETGENKIKAHVFGRDVVGGWMTITAIMTKKELEELKLADLVAGKVH